MLKIKLLAATFAALMMSSEHAAMAASGGGDKITVAVFGDWPYNQNLLDNAALLLNSINGDPEVRRVIHVGDIHSGSMACTGAGLDPIPSGAVPGWNQRVYSVFQQFNAPVIYTPGDNEWTDCHKTKEKSSGYPLNELASVRSLFFARPGKTLGLNDMPVWSQAKNFDPRNKTDSQFVENTMWEDAGVLFVTLNMPGSNNDGLKWTAPFTNETARLKEVAERNQANLSWLNAAFWRARNSQKKAIVIALQADMWDPEALPSANPPGDGLENYTPFVQQLAALTLTFGRPVLLLNGDSHKAKTDKPLADPSSDITKIHNIRQAVPNLTRIVVQGSTNNPAEWLRLTIDPNTSDVFSAKNVVYCQDVATCKVP